MFLLCLFACAGVNPIPGTPECAAHESVIDFHASEDWREDERPELVGATADWRAFSSGRVRHSIKFGAASFWSPQILRVESWMPVVKDAEARQTEKRKSSTTLFGWHASDPRRIYLVVDRVPLNQLRHLATHELGHAAEIEWPNCKETPEQRCVHSPDPNAAMAAAFSNAPLGPSDLEFCRASCLCP